MYITQIHLSETDTAAAQSEVRLHLKKKNRLVPSCRGLSGTWSVQINNKDKSSCLCKRYEVGNSWYASYEHVSFLHARFPLFFLVCFFNKNAGVHLVNKYETFLEKGKKKPFKLLKFRKDLIFLQTAADKETRRLFSKVSFLWINVRTVAAIFLFLESSSHSLLALLVLGAIISPTIRSSCSWSQPVTHS